MDNKDKVLIYVWETTVLDAIRFIHERSNLSEDTIIKVLEFEEEYMKSIGIITEDSMSTGEDEVQIVNMDDEDKVLIYVREDAIRFIHERSNLSEDTIIKVLEFEEEYMRSIGIITEDSMSTREDEA